MTLRRIALATSLATALSLGVLALPAAAAPATTSVAPTYTFTGKDPLATFADAAMNAWLEYSVNGSSKGLTDFNKLRDALALEAARRVGADGARMQAAWRNADQRHQVVLMAAMTQLGTPYKRNTSKPGVGFDCSGLTTWAYAQVGATLPRQSRSQINLVKRVTQATAQAGDLVYYPGHVMLYLGVDNFILHAPFTGRTVEFSHIKANRAGSALYGNPLG